MSVLVNVRVDGHVRETWKAEAQRLGVTLSDFVKGAVEARLRGPAIQLNVSDAVPTNPPLTPANHASAVYRRSFKPDFKKGKK